MDLKAFRSGFSCARRPPCVDEDTQDEQHANHMLVTSSVVSMRFKLMGNRSLGYFQQLCSATVGFQDEVSDLQPSSVQDLTTTNTNNNDIRAKKNKNNTHDKTMTIILRTMTDDILPNTRKL